jgi:hypothetical protein
MNMKYIFKKPKTTVTIEDESIIFNRGNNLMIHKAMRGQTTVIISKITEIKFKTATRFKDGYLQFSTPRTSILGAARTVDQPQNAIKFNIEEENLAIDLKNSVEKIMSSKE